MIEDIKSDAQSRMRKTLEALETELKKIRTGRAHPSLLDGVTLSYYGNPTPLNQVANISVEEGRTLTVSPWEKHLINDIQKAILASDLGLNPSTSGDLIRLPLPPLTEETRKELIKVVRKEGETARVGIRNIRRDANADIKDLLKEKEIGEDEARGAEDQTQKLTDQFVQKIEKLLQVKEEELLKF